MALDENILPNIIVFIAAKAKKILLVIFLVLYDNSAVEYIQKHI